MADHAAERSVALAFGCSSPSAAGALLLRRACAPRRDRLAGVYAELPDRPPLLRVLGRRLDAEMLAIDMAELDGLTPRERLFELIMRRLDAMAPFKPSLRAIGREAPRTRAAGSPPAATSIGSAVAWSTPPALPGGTVMHGLPGEQLA